MRRSKRLEDARVAPVVARARRSTLRSGAAVLRRRSGPTTSAAGGPRPARAGRRRRRRRCPPSAKRSVSATSDAALGDEAVAVPGEIRRRLAEAGGAVQLHGEVLRGRRAHELLAVLPLADDDVRRGEVREHGRARQRGDRARRHRRPEVLADVGVQHEVAEMRARGPGRRCRTAPRAPSSVDRGRARVAPPAGTSAARRTRGSSADTTSAPPRPAGRGTA